MSDQEVPIVPVRRASRRWLEPIGIRAAGAARREVPPNHERRGTDTVAHTAGYVTTTRAVRIAAGQRYRPDGRRRGTRRSRRYHS